MDLGAQIVHATTATGSNDPAKQVSVDQWNEDHDIQFTGFPMDPGVFLNGEGNFTAASGPQGPQGADGAKGDQGAQGAAGSNGAQGAQGAAGSNGAQGAQGAKGDQGTQGTQGAAGSNGSQGSQGAQGLTGGVSALLSFDTATGTPPAAGGCRFNNATFGSITHVYVSQHDRNGVAINALEALIVAGAVLDIVTEADATKFATFSVTAAAAAGSGGTAYYDLTVTPASGQVLSNGAAIAFGFSVAGPQGAQGSAGSNGSQGAQGDQGAQGAAGAGLSTVYAVQGAQMDLSAQTFTNITGLTTGALSISTTYAFKAVIGHQVQAGTQGAQYAVQCSVAGATVEAQINGTQTASTMSGFRINAQGAQSTAVAHVAGDNIVEIEGTVITPGSGSPTIGIQCKGVQASQAHHIRAGSFLRVEKTS